MLPFYHPTKVLVLDDDPLFLESFNFQFGSDISCLPFVRPDAALTYIRSQQEGYPYLSSVFDLCPLPKAELSLQAGERLLRFRAPRLGSILQDTSRFERISVAVVDFEMPNMTGIQFCRAIRDLPIKSILLTGKASLDAAVGAFNENIIDHFIQKQKPNLTTLLRAEIKRLQEAYFASILEPLRSAYYADQHNFLSDPEFVELFHNLSRSRQISEYYITAEPPGVFMISRDETKSFVLVSNDDVLSAHVELAEDRGAPTELVAMLRNHTALAWFPTFGGCYQPEFRTNWKDFVWPAQTSHSKRGWCFSLIHHSAQTQPLFTMLMNPLEAQREPSKVDLRVLH